MAEPPIAPPAGQVPVFVPGLGVRVVDKKDAAAAIADGARHASAAEYEHAKKEAEFSGVEGHVAPALAGAARGLTFGGSDVALAGLGGDKVRKRLLDYQEYSPTASALGEFGGIAAGALLGDEAGLGRLPGLVARGGRAVETGVAEGLGGGLLARTTGRVASGAAEGAIYETGKAAGDSALRDEDLTAQKVIAAAGHGALYGAGANALFGGAADLVSHSAGSLRGLRDVGTDAAGAETGSIRGRIGDALEKGSDVKTIKALGGSAGDISKLESGVAGGYRRVAHDIRTDIETSTGKSIGQHTRESLHEYAAKRVDELGEQIGAQLKKLDEAGAGHAPDAKAFAAKVREELIAPHLVQTPAGPVVAPGAASTVKAIDKFVSQIEAATEGRAPTFTEWQSWRKNLDREIYKGAAKVSPATESLRQLRGIMEKELETSGEAAAKSMGATFADQYQATKSLYQSVRKAEELTARGVGKELANNSIGLRASIGALSGIATGNPLAGIAMGIAGKVVQDRGDMLAADLLHRAANLFGVTKLAAKTDATMASGVAKLVGVKARDAATLAAPVRTARAAPLGVALSGNPRKDFEGVREALTTATTNPSLMVDRVARALGPDAAKSPGIANAITQRMLAGVTFLNDKLPPARQDSFTLQPQLQGKSNASDSEMAKFMRYAEAVDNPTMVLHEARSGTLSRDHVEAVKAVYPKLYKQMQEEVMHAVTSSKTEMPYSTRIQLGILLDIPTDRTLAPDFLRAIQATYSSAESAETTPASPTLARPLAIANGQATPLQSALSEGLEK